MTYSLSTLTSNWRGNATKFGRNTRGIAATEFALIAPILIVMSMGIGEMFFRYTAFDQFNRYTFQVGDMLSRSSALTTAQLSEHYKARTFILNEIDSTNMVFNIKSFGIDKERDARLLWERNLGGDKNTVDPDDLDGLGEPGETIMHFTISMTYQTPVDLLGWVPPMHLKRTVYFRPRETRAIAIDGEIAETNKDWDDL